MAMTKEATRGRRGLWQRLKGLLTQSGRQAESGRTGVRGSSMPSGWLGGGLHVALIEPPPLLAEPFASLLDFDALEREAGRVRQGATEPQQPRREPKGLRAILKPDVTRTEGLLLTTELSRLVSCRVARPGCCGADRQGTGATPLLLHLTDTGLEICFA